MRTAIEIRRRLELGLTPVRLEIIDDSAAHAGHSGARPGGETHFTVIAVAPAFDGRSRLDRQRLVHAMLADLLAGPVHALSLRLLTPAEDAAA